MLVDLQRARGKMKSAAVRENMLQHQTRNPVRGLLTHDIGACLFHHLAEMNSRRTHGFTRPAIQAPKHMFAEGFRDACPAFIQRAHQIDSAARRIHFAAEHAIRRARRQTQSAVNAIEVKLILRRCGGQGSVSFPDRTCVSCPASNALLHRERRRCLSGDENPLGPAQ